MNDETTLVRPEWRPLSGRRTIDGVLFLSYSTGIQRYCQVSEDGQIATAANSRLTAYTARVMGHGYIISKESGRHHAFRSQAAAAKAAIKVWRALKAKTP